MRTKTKNTFRNTLADIGLMATAPIIACGLLFGLPRLLPPLPTVTISMPLKVGAEVRGQIETYMVERISKKGAEITAYGLGEIAAITRAVPFNGSARVAFAKVTVDLDQGVVRICEGSKCPERP